MSRQGRRIHRLPQRLDYTLIPAPLDFSLPLTNEKSLLPAIIVTPSTPTNECARQFYIAFSPKPTLRERVSNYITPFQTPFQLRSRTVVILSILLFIVVCHLFTHQFVTHRPHLRFDNFETGHQYGGDHLDMSYRGWFGIKSLWNASATTERSFMVHEPLSS
ncbi:hypothetical protein PILCRDRAFT_818983 [Piloderma croceum F 1598]|uniref:Uncharacterized protein n=1 Tax=Piloderma croceum (strain F 1598) TaxID=765440 RepID=A0A0C3BCC6_PILCF|nr:hypothetical protein PILCRDRAFT_818983 [Piloderma croceum F 1598]